MKVWNETPTPVGPEGLFASQLSVSWEAGKPDSAWMISGKWFSPVVQQGAQYRAPCL